MPVMFPSAAGVNDAAAALVLMVTVTCAESWLTEGGLKLHLAPPGKPLHANVMAPRPLLESTLTTVEVESPGNTCKLTSCAVMMRGVVPICVGSLAVLLAVLTSPPPETPAVLITVGWMLVGTFTTRVMAG